MLSGTYLLLLILSYVSADCGCLRCSKHLQGIDIRGPQGRPIKVIFKKPTLKPEAPGLGLSESGYSAAVQPPYQIGHQSYLPKFYNYKIDRETTGTQKGTSETKRQYENEGQSYSALVQVPVPETSKVQKSLYNLQYHTDSVLVPPPKCYGMEEQLVDNPFPIPPFTKPVGSKPTCPCCCRCVDRTETDMCIRCKRSIWGITKDSNDESAHCENKNCPRTKRNIAEHGYNFLMNMLPPFVREPLRHSIRGSTMLRQSKPDLRVKLEELKLRKALEHRNMYNQQKSLSYNARKELMGYDAKNHRYPYIDSTQMHAKHFYPNVPRFLDTHARSLALTDKSTLPYKKSKRYPDESSLENEQHKYELFKKRRDYMTPKSVVSRIHNDERGDEATLLRKLKRLNNNHFTSDLEDQATAFIDQLVSPEKNTKRIKRYLDDSGKDSKELEIGESDAQEFVSDESASKEHQDYHTRNKRTIILSSDEVDLPPQYEIEEVSVEDNDDYRDEMVASFEDSGEPDEEIVAYSPFTRRMSGRKISRLFEPKPDLILGRNVIQKAVRDELNNYHKKIEIDQKIKELKQNIEKKRNDPYGMGDTIPSNPIFMFLTAPMRFLRHFQDINKGISPVMTSLPKLVHTTKSYFRNFGKNFHKNCLNLASDIIGDFDNIQPNSIIQKIDEPHYGRYRRSINDEDPCTIKSLDNPTKINLNSIIKEFETKSVQNDITCFKPIEEDLSQLQKELNSTSFGYLTSFLDKIQGIIDYFSTSESKEDPKPSRVTPEYSEVFSSSQENTNFRTLASEHVRKKRYIVKIVNDDEEVKEQVQDYLAEQLEDDNEYLKPVRDYYNKLENIWTKSRSDLEKISDTMIPNSSEDSYEDRPKKKKIVVKKIKPRIIIDNKGLPFMEYKGYKRPLFLHKRKLDVVKSSQHFEPRSTEETGKRIDMLISRAKETSEVVGSVQNNIVPRQIVRERISSLLEEIDQLERLNAEDYDEIFENLIKIQYIKYSVEQDWKRILIENRADDLHAQIGLLSKFKDLQHLKDITVQIIAEALKKCDNEFARRNLVHTLIRLEKLQVLITSVIDDFDQNFKMKTKLNTKKEIKYVDYLSDLNFVNAKTRNDLVKNLGRDRDKEGQQNIDVLNKLKKILVSDNEEEMDKIARTIWEMNNLKKLQTDTIKDINKKIRKYYKIKKELKILFDLQKRFEECGYELGELLGNVSAPVKNLSAKKPLRKDIKEIIAEIKKKREETLQKALERRNNLLKKKS